MLLLKLKAYKINNIFYLSSFTSSLENIKSILKTSDSYPSVIKDFEFLKAEKISFTDFSGASSDIINKVSDIFDLSLKGDFLFSIEKPNKTSKNINETILLLRQSKCGLFYILSTRPDSKKISYRITIPVFEVDSITFDTKNIIKSVLEDGKELVVKLHDIKNCVELESEYDEDELYSVED